jgi:hypothetical protein
MPHRAISPTLFDIHGRGLEGWSHIDPFVGKGSCGNEGWTAWPICPEAKLFHAHITCSGWGNLSIAGAQRLIHSWHLILNISVMTWYVSSTLGYTWYLIGLYSFLWQHPLLDPVVFYCSIMHGSTIPKRLPTLFIAMVSQICMDRCDSDPRMVSTCRHTLQTISQSNKDFL